MNKHIFRLTNSKKNILEMSNWIASFRNIVYNTVQTLYDLSGTIRILAYPNEQKHAQSVPFIFAVNRTQWTLWN